MFQGMCLIGGQILPSVLKKRGMVNTLVVDGGEGAM